MGELDLVFVASVSVCLRMRVRSFAIADFGGRPRFRATFFGLATSAVASFLAASNTLSWSGGFAAVVVVVIVVEVVEDGFAREPVTSVLTPSSQSKVTTSVEVLGPREEAVDVVVVVVGGSSDEGGFPPLLRLHDDGWGGKVTRLNS